MKNYTYLVTVPAKHVYDDDYGNYYEYDLVNNPNGVDEKNVLNTFWNFYGDIGWDGEKNRYTSKPAIRRLIDDFGYKLTHFRKNGVREDVAFIELTVTTNALGSHLLTILDTISDDIKNQTSGGFSVHVEAAGYKHSGWQNLNPVDIIDCEHKRSKRIMITNDKDGTIVDVRECSKCKGLFKRVVP